MFMIRFLHIAYPLLNNDFSPFLWVEVFSMFLYPEKMCGELYGTGFCWSGDDQMILGAAERVFCAVSISTSSGHSPKKGKWKHKHLFKHFF